MKQTYPLMFTPGRIGRLKMKNRLLHPPMARNYAGADGEAAQSTGPETGHVNRAHRPTAVHATD